MSKKYSYNGAVLPQLPEDVLANYPYIVIVQDAITGGCIMNASVVPSERFYSYQTSAGGYTITHELDGLGYPGRGVYGTNAGDVWKISAELSSESALVGPPGYWGYDTLANADGDVLSTIVWSNHDIYDIYGVLYYTASDDPIPVIEGFDIRSWCIGYALGLTGKPLPLGTGKVLVGYSYNGAVLPALPSEVETHPYAVIWYTEHNGADGKPHAWLRLMDAPCTYSGSVIKGYTMTGSAIRFDWIADETTLEWSGWLGLPDGMVANQWVHSETTSGTDITVGTASSYWSNFDILDKNGAVHFEGSTAIPVYE